MKLQDIFKQYGKTDLLEDKIDDLGKYSLRYYQRLWLSWYRGNVRSFHNYTIYNGMNKIRLRRRSMGMAKTVCEDWASLLFNEKTEITMSDEGTQAILNGIFDDCDFWQEANQGIEKAFALGMGAFVVRVDNLELVPDTGEVKKEGASVKVEFVNGTKIYPFTIDNHEISECAFVTRRGKKIYISMHLLNDAGNYEINNISGTVGKSGEIVYDEKTDIYTFDTGSPKKWYQIIKPNIANNIDPDSPLGVSVFANAIDQLETTDIIFDSFGNEFNLGRKRVYASAEAVAIDDEKGEKRATFDPNDVVFYVFPKGTAIGTDDKPYVQESTGELRADSFDKGINKALNLLSKKCGLGENYYRFDVNGIATATQVISENSATFRTVRRHEILIESVLTNLIKTILYAVNKFTAQTVNEASEITVQFDDSIIEDKASERTRDSQEVSVGLMEPWEFRMKWYGQSEEEAKQWQKDREAEKPKITDVYSMFGGGGEGANT